MMIAHDFANGIEVLQKYFSDQTQICVIENSTITVEKLRRVIDSDKHYLDLIGWHVSYSIGPEEWCLAEFTSLKYVDT